MAGIRLLPEEPETTPQQQARAAAAAVTTTTDSLASDDDRSIAADSWSIKSEYGSTLDDDQRHADAAEALSSANFRVSSDYSSDKEEPDADGGGQSMLGLLSYWDAAYSDELTNFREHGHAGEVWFGDDVMEIVTSWTKDLCIEISQKNMSVSDNDVTTEVNDQADKYLSSWNVLDLGTGNGLLLHQLAKEGFTDLTGTDYSEGAVELAQHLSQRDGFPNIRFMVDDILDTKLEQQFKLVMDKGTLDAIGLHPDGPVKRVMYWDSVSKLVAPGGILVITSCNHTKDELVEEVENFNIRKSNLCRGDENDANNALSSGSEAANKIDQPPFEYLSHVRTYPTFMFGGSVGSRVATVAFLRK
ncbi:S-adenosyl-L-methionine-dependent methyltransferase [Arabidopsis thaliana x Arabidopsis arenosa]|uniref:Protein-lysine N-methyltransferase ISN45_Aa02g013760 n=1 Tax=Arabidopsis thaliana x Arabidopsis arenosa TaxID=1240361 RepID=A0A8T2BJ49_9BRAS|nr:S-adenosyl-L-methionine-dependent methyltransferase [Arabidopsis thaliana x Arabidopsis arenosa]